MENLSRENKNRNMNQFPEATDDSRLNIDDIEQLISDFNDHDKNSHTMPKDLGDCADNSPLSFLTNLPSSTSQNASFRPYIQIIEQPSSGIRFRYPIEGRSAGSIPGKNSTASSKTYPTIRIMGYRGKMTIIVSCVTYEESSNLLPKPHPHRLVGKENCKKGVCRVDIKGENMTVAFPNLGIQCVKRKDVEESLKERKKNNIDPFRTGYDHMKNPSNIALNAVRLCFQGFIPKGKGGWESLEPVASDPIFEKKATCELSIKTLSHCSASAIGNVTMIILCEKVPKDDIEVRFYEEKAGQIVWEGFGDFQPTDVHHQYAIVLRTPRYHDIDITHPVEVYIQLRLKSTKKEGIPCKFKILPLGTSRSSFWYLRKPFVKKKTDYSVIDKLSFFETPLFSNFNLKTPSNIDQLNKNNDLNLKKAQDKFSILRALYDLHNNRNNCTSQSRDIEMKSNLELHDSSRKINFENSERNVASVNFEFSTFNEINNIDLVKDDLNFDSTYKSSCSDNAEISKWIQKNQELEKFEKRKNFNENEKQSLNELTSELAELEEIYEDTHKKLVRDCHNDNAKKDDVMHKDFHDNMTYTSLQMAMKNPLDYLDQEKVEYDDVPICSPIIDITSPPSSATKRDGTSEIEERLSPLPPKRIRKTPSVPPLPCSITLETLAEANLTLEAPNKNLPSPPGILPKLTKQGLFSKLFAKKQKKVKDSFVDTETGNDRSLNIAESISSSRNHKFDQHQLPSVTDMNVVRLEGDESPPYGFELTEAENYALYTAMFPRATLSEFDELSSYYSPVEGGKILTKVEEI